LSIQHLHHSRRSERASPSSIHLVEPGIIRGCDETTPDWLELRDLPPESKNDSRFICVADVLAPTSLRGLRFGKQLAGWLVPL
jgi:hypothetical protein